MACSEDCLTVFLLYPAFYRISILSVVSALLLELGGGGVNKCHI